MQIKESDWKKFRKKIANWQERYMERLTEEYVQILQSDKPASAKFWELEKRIKKDKKSPGVLIEMRRSTAIENIVILVLDGVITLDELNDFSDDLQETVKSLLEIYKNI
ncbi:multidrug transporter [Floccifex sp.]|uniref:multidrug transporter n=1 Tax=Floccifex sp. TaxID=2815810 RepID=UPI002A7614D6|nr:multidrug transporter [Floccifex sp.]MDD7282215.1 multidrug transporter [Erysipelotrichaceae bacterium]MDY2957740.1 multidrug transporter [Floccifex sp.]